MMLKLSLAKAELVNKTPKVTTNSAFFTHAIAGILISHITNNEKVCVYLF